MSSFFIDTSVFISTIKTDDATESCERFIRRVRNRFFNGYISPYVAGEMIHAILYSEEIKQNKKTGYLFDSLEAIISSNAEWFIPENNDLCLFSQLREVDNRVEDGDILHATCAKILNIPLVTIDGKLLRSQGLKNQGIEILHPTQVIEKA
ncbi:MAG: PIN domain-containing protein [Candidatus Methanoperedens sp.]|nr:PIN domain-containing protein [Candidatus Methanoperedens sp.]